MSEPIVVDGQTLHPEMALLLELRDRRPRQSFAEMAPAEFRAATLRDSITVAGPPTPVEAVTDLSVEGATGPLRARFYQPALQWSALLVFFHGGGFVYGDVDSHDGTCRLLSATGGFAVLSVEYRLAPEHPHPAAVDDAFAAWQWVLANADALPGAPADPRIAIGGDSAGGLLATVASQLAVRAGVTAPAAQVLIYPAVDRDFTTRSMEQFGEGFFLTRPDMEFFEACLRGGAPADPTDFRRHPLHGELAGLPPALVVTAGFDPLRDSGEAYVDALNKAGTPATLRRFDGLLHGFVNMIGFSPACRAATVEIAELAAALMAVEPETATSGS
jgi:acetyl esterase